MLRNHPYLSEWIEIVESGKFNTCEEMKLLIKFVKKILDRSDVIFVPHFVEDYVKLTEKYFFKLMPDQKFYASLILSLFHKPKDKDVSERDLEPFFTNIFLMAGRGWGRSELAQKAYNFFGIKASKEWTGKVYTKSTWEQRADGVKYEIKADFRKYNSISESIIDHDNFFVSTDWRKKNYKRVLEAANYKEQAQALRACGYATDLNYSDKLIRLIEEHKLYKYDKEIKMDKVSSWAKEAWDWAKEKGITDGSNPQGNCTREQIIVMLKRYDEMIRKEIQNEN